MDNKKIKKIFTYTIFWFIPGLFITFITLLIYYAINWETTYNILNIFKEITKKSLIGGLVTLITFTLFYMMFKKEGSQKNNLKNSSPSSIVNQE